MRSLRRSRTGRCAAEPPPRLAAIDCPSAGSSNFSTSFSRYSRTPPPTIVQPRPVGGQGPVQTKTSTNARRLDTQLRNQQRFRVRHGDATTAPCGSGLRGHPGAWLLAESRRTTSRTTACADRSSPRETPHSERADRHIPAAVRAACIDLPRVVRSRTSSTRRGGRLVGNLLIRTLTAALVFAVSCNAAACRVQCQSSRENPMRRAPPTVQRPRLIPFLLLSSSFRGMRAT